MRNCKLYNIYKNRKATANEVAKMLILDKLESVIVNESFGCDDLNEDEVLEVMKFYNKHVDAIQKRLGNQYINMK